MTASKVWSYRSTRDISCITLEQLRIFVGGAKREHATVAAKALRGAAGLGFVEGEVNEPALAHWNVGRDPMVLVGHEGAERIDEDWLRTAR